MGKGKKWTDEEIEMMRRGEFPPGRSRDATYMMRIKFGFTTAVHKPWTEEEIDLVRSGAIPEGRSYDAARNIAERRHFRFRPKRPGYGSGSRCKAKVEYSKKQNNIFAWQKEFIRNGLKHRNENKTV